MGQIEHIFTQCMFDCFLSEGTVKEDCLEQTQKLQKAQMFSLNPGCTFSEIW